MILKVGISRSQLFFVVVVLYNKKTKKESYLVLKT